MFSPEIHVMDCDERKGATWEQELGPSASLLHCHVLIESVLVGYLHRMLPLDVGVQLAWKLLIWFHAAAANQPETSRLDAHHRFGLVTLVTARLQLGIGGC